MPPLSPEFRTIIWVVVGIATLMFAPISLILEANLMFLVRKLLPQLRKEGGRPPAKKPFIVWFLFSVSVFIMIAGTAIASSAPESLSLPTSIVHAIPTNTPSITNTLAPTFTPFPTQTPAPTPTSCDAARIISPQDGQKIPVHDGRFILEWVPSYCIMTVHLKTDSGILREATYVQQESGQVFSTRDFIKMGVVTVGIWSYDVDYRMEEPIDIVTFVVRP